MTHRPVVGGGTAYSTTPSMAEMPALATAPSDLMAMLVRPPSLLPGEGFSMGLTPARAVYRVYHSRAPWSCLHDSAVRAWRYRIGSAPNSSGTSVRIDVPSRATRRSLATPSFKDAATTE